MGSYRVLIARSAERDIDRLPLGVKNRIITGISNLSDNPRPLGSTKLAGKDHYRLRVGDYRVIYGIDDTNKLVDIIHAGHRKDIYR